MGWADFVDFLLVPRDVVAVVRPDRRVVGAGVDDDRNIRGGPLASRRPP